jgi:protein gp37
MSIEANMAQNSKIEWTNDTWNPIRARNRRTGKLGWHCEHVTAGCVNCYAERRNKWVGTGLPFKPGHRADLDIFLEEKMLLAPVRWKKPRMIFVCSMTDLFADFVPDEWIDKVFAVMALCPQHTFQVLTKRPERMRRYMTTADDEKLGRPNGEGERRDHIMVDAFGIRDDLSEGRQLLSHSDEECLVRPERWPLPNVWLGITAENQARADARIPHLLETPAAVRFISAEPLLGPIDLMQWLRDGDSDSPRLDGVIVGGESGPNARPMHPQWARSIRDQCAQARVPFFFKQWGEHIAEMVPGTGVDLRRDLEPNQSVAWGDGKTYHTRYTRVGKKAAGRLLDGREHKEWPAMQNTKPERAPHG